MFTSSDKIGSVQGSMAIDCSCLQIAEKPGTCWEGCQLVGYIVE